MNEKNRILRNVDILIEEDRIKKIGRGLKEKVDEIINGKGKLALPGFINCHTHSPMILFRGIADDLPLMEWLTKHIWPREKRLKPKHIYIGCLLACMEMIRSGITCFNDMYFYANEAAKAAEEVGIRSVLSSVLLDVLPEKAGWNIFIKILKELERLKSPLITPALGPHSVYACSLENLRRIKELMSNKNFRVHIHISETKEEVKKIKKRYGKTPVEILDEIGLLNSKTIAAHCVHLTQKDIQILSKRNVKVVHNPVSNMKLVSGILPLKKLLSANICISLGTDGPVSNNSLNMFQEMKFASLLHKIHTSNPTTLPAELALKLATTNGAKTLNLEEEIGSIEVGKKADIILLNLNSINFFPISSPKSLFSHLVYSAGNDSVETVIVNGRILMKNGEILTVNEEKVRKMGEKLILQLSD